MTVEILLATYNGAAFIEPFLESIKKQTYTDISLIIRDDGSSDSTVDLINQSLSTWNKPWKWVTTLTPTRGVIQNFSALMQESTAPYVMFADQDDVWLPEKITKSLTKMKQLESEIGSAHPILVHSDLQVVDADLNLIAPSFWKYSGLNPSFKSLNRTLIQNYVPGCSMLMNRSLVNLAGKVPIQAIMHDWWIVLVASAFGEIGCLHEAMTLYRQHANNCIGAKKNRLIQISQIGKKLENIKKRLQEVTVQQGKAFYTHFKKQMSPRQIMMLEDFIHIHEMNFYKKRMILIRYHFFKHYWYNNIGLFLLI